MKKIYLSIATSLLCGTMLMAQAPANRTIQTVIADAVAQMPAQTQKKYDKLIADLVSTGDAGVQSLIDMIHAPGKGSNAQVDYALSGLSHYVMAKGQESARLAVANAYIKALERVQERETKAFIIRQLQIVGENEAVKALSPYLNTEQLSAPAASALASINTPEAADALKSSLMRRMGTSVTLRDVVMAIGEAEMTGLEDLIKGFLTASDENLKRTAFYAISRTGSVASLKEVGDAAKAVGFQMENAGINEAYIQLIKRIALTDEKTAIKAAAKLLKDATKVGATQTRIAALGLLISMDDDNATKLVLAALKDPCKEYRNAALTFASTYAGEKDYIDILKSTLKAKSDVKTDVINWIGRESKSQNQILKNLDVRFDLPLRQVLLNQLSDNDFAVKQAAVWALVKIGDESVIPNLSNLLKDNDKQVVLLAEDALLAFKGDVAPSVAQAIQGATDAGKIAGVEILAVRKATPNMNTVLEQTKSTVPEVKTAAYKALKDVVSDKDRVMLCGMLESSDASVVTPLQQAVIATLSGKSSSEQLSTIKTRMVQAGENKKHLYYTVLASIGEKEGLKTIVDGFKNGKGEARDAAFDALLAWKSADVADELYAICKDASAFAYFDRALTAYIGLVSTPTLTGENRLLGLRKAMEIAKTDAQKNEILKQAGRTGTFLAMLFAGDYLNDKPVQQAAANAVMTIALGHKEYIGDNVRALLNKVTEVLDNPDAGYQKEAIRKHLAEMPAGEGFISLFNGKDLTGWKGLVENPIKRAKMSSAQLAKAQVKADEQMRKDWKVEDGLLLFDGTGYDNLCTEKQYGDFEMYVDWMLDPAGPEADAGIYLRGTPQVQMWDTARVNVGAQVGSGGLYNNQVNSSKPLKVADNKLGEWNTMYIKMVGDRVTVVLNGELVTDDVILENYWDRKQPIPPVEQIELQAHGSKVYYRNIYVKELERAEPFQLSAEEKKEGYKILFDGTNMHEWTGNTVDYTLEDGTISMIPSRSFGGNLYTKDEYGNFIFRFEFQLTPAANNGLGIRTPLEGDAAYVGMELQILDNEHPVYATLAPYQYHGSVYGIIPAERGYLKPTGEWNYQEVVANGDNIKVTLNGHVIVDGNIRDAVKNGTPDKKEHPGLFNKKGHIGFLGHGSPVKFRNIRIKELK
ncbi:family 16 glycoside hydrolase [Massilibacteroides sp.]|uniref:DUF1080 domain-containing protein n=1 Tax=Massilibacteroides sp. TaxID=2034766 RepID=UPI002633774A|nr:family 16 glycoside hydrolase [Massilibacteroides sp.]MDD4514385.1 DUF1080 domain-containing protein [Massilibacteroides sp.]